MDNYPVETICQIHGHRYSDGICVDCYALQKCNYCGYQFDHKFCDDCEQIICNRCKIVKYVTTPEGNYICIDCKKNK